MAPGGGEQCNGAKTRPLFSLAIHKKLCTLVLAMKNTFLLLGTTAAGESHALKVAAVEVAYVHMLATILGFTDWDVQTWTNSDDAATAGRLQQIGGSVWHVNPAPVAAVGVPFGV